MRDGRRGLERHRQGPADQLGGIARHHPQDLVGDDPILVAEVDLVDASAELVGRGGPLVDGGAPDKALDVALGQRRARGRHLVFVPPGPGPEAGPG